MALTTGTALKELIEGLGLGLTAYRDEAPPRTHRPFVEILEGIDLVPGPIEDGGPGVVAETAQVDLWQNYMVKQTTAKGEDPALAPALMRGLHGKRLSLVGSAITYMVRVAHSIRTFEQDSNIVHHAITLTIDKEM